MRHLPAGTVTFLFTDMEGSTTLLHELGAEHYACALAEHRRVLRDAFATYGGVEVDTQGDAFFVAFPTAPGALQAAAQARAALEPGPIRVRMGVHTGTPHLAEEGYVGQDVHRAARIAGAGHGGQVLVSSTTASLISGAGLRDLGEHRFKDLSAPERVYQLGEEDFPPLKTLNATNLPVQPTPFLGRERELGEVLALLARDETRLLTLTGAGGSGKTRLALQAAAQSVEYFPHGVWWVPLQAVTDPALVLPAVGQTLGADDLAAHIADRRMLLLLDNVEQVVDAARELADLLTRCRNLRVLTTSREPLHIEAEQEYAVPPLAEQEAIGFFVARARAVDPGFSAGDAVRELCVRLDCLPLALELAAARVKVLSPERMLLRLERALPLLTGGRRDAPARQRTLRGAIEWSYELLTGDEQRLFVRLAVFAGGCTVEAAEAVCEAGLDALQSLVDKSLLRVDGGRFHMLETIREYASERLEESHESNGMRRRHAEHFLAVAESANLSLDTVGHGPQLHDAVLLEQHNMRAALDWAVQADVELGLRLAVALENFWITNDPAEGASRFAALLARADAVDPILRARALRDYAGTTGMAGDQETAARLTEDALELFRDVGDERGVTELTFRLGVVAIFAGNYERGRRLFDESLTVFRRLGDIPGEIQALGSLGWLDFEEGKRARGWERTLRTLELSREVGWVWAEGWRIAELAERCLEEGRVDEAETYARQFVEIARRTDEREAKVTGLAQLAWVAAERGDHALAGSLWAAVEAEEARGRMARWETYRDRYARHMPLGPRPEAQLTLDAAVEMALARA